MLALWLFMRDLSQEGSLLSAVNQLLHQTTDDELQQIFQSTQTLLNHLKSHANGRKIKLEN